MEYLLKESFTLIFYNFIAIILVTYFLVMRYIFQDEAENKKKDILEYLREQTEGKISFDLLEDELKNFCTITPAEGESNLMPLGKGKPLSKIVLHDDVVYSIKSGNIKINYKKLFDPICEAFLSGLEVWEHRSLLIIVGLLTTKKIFNLTKIAIKEQHAITITSLWKLADRNSLIVPRKDLTKRINELLITINKNLLTDSQLDSILSDLDYIKSIRLNKEGTISLIEKIEITF